MRHLLFGTSINTFFGRIAALRRYVKWTRNLAVYAILWLRPLRLTSLCELVYAETLRWFSRLLRSVRLWRMNNALERIYSTDMPSTGKLHPKFCIYRSAIFILALLPALANAEIVPEKSPYDSRMRVIAYNRMDVVKLSTFYGVSTHVEFGENEQIRDVAIGDDQAWSIVPRGNHLFIKPKATKADTNVTVVTDKHVYNFALVVQPRSVKDASAWKDPNLVYGVTFRYPEQEAAKLAAEQAEKAKAIAEKRRLDQMKDKLAKATKDSVAAGHQGKPLDAQNYNYWMAGSTEISPTAARDDGRFTYLSFSNNRDMPAVYSVDAFGMESLINTSVEGNTIIIHRVVPKLRLRKGNAVVCIRNDAFNPNGGTDNAAGTIAPDVERVIKGGR